MQSSTGCGTKSFVIPEYGRLFFLRTFEELTFILHNVFNPINFSLFFLTTITAKSGEIT